jgi:hypothetical protein
MALERANGGVFFFDYRTKGKCEFFCWVPQQTAKKIDRSSKEFEAALKKNKR